MNYNIPNLLSSSSKTDHRTSQTFPQNWTELRTLPQILTKISFIIPNWTSNSSNPSKSCTPSWWSYQIRFFDTIQNSTGRGSIEPKQNFFPRWDFSFQIMLLVWSQLFVYKTPFDLWHRNRWWHRKTMLVKT